MVIFRERWPLNVHSFLPGGCRRSVACWHFCQDVFLVGVSVNIFKPNKANYILSVLFLVWEVAFSSASLCPLNSQRNDSFALLKPKWTLIISNINYLTSISFLLLAVEAPLVGCLPPLCQEASVIFLLILFTQWLWFFDERKKRKWASRFQSSAQVCSGEWWT